MSKQLLISDANIIIDIAVAGLLEAMFSLDYEFGISDIQFSAELEGQHPELPAAGLKLIELQSKAINAASTLLENNTQLKVSIYDCLALSLAQQERCTLLTGDGKLKQLAISEGVTVRGTLWLMEQMLVVGAITVDEAAHAYSKMLDDGSRLPKNEIQKQLKIFRTKK
ncbi:MAG TPA: DUF3368 domain-containing protein [Gammaproteobacteria bacterium]|nr:DUF3368 domain-containing protein [Gammaproteobacteria bacterium]